MQLLASAQAATTEAIRDVIEPAKECPRFSAKRAVLQTVMTEVKKKGKIKTILKLFASNLSHDAPRGETMIGYSLGAAGIYFSLSVVQAID